MVAKSIEAYLAEVIVQENGCWSHPLKPRPDGYRRVGGSTNRVNGLLHRLLYEHLKGAVPPGLDLDHTCRNRGCCNPEHLEPVSRQENCRRGMCGQHLRERTHCPSGHQYDGVNTYGRRTCSICRLEQSKLSKRRKREARRGRG